MCPAILYIMCPAVLNILHRSRARALPSKCFMSYPEYSFMGGLLPLCRDAVSVFNSPKPTGHTKGEGAVDHCYLPDVSRNFALVARTLMINHSLLERHHELQGHIPNPRCKSIVGFLNTNSPVFGDTGCSGWTLFEELGNSLSWNQSIRLSRQRIFSYWLQLPKDRSYSLDCLGNSSCQEERTVTTTCCKCFTCCEIVHIIVDQYLLISSSSY